MSPISIQGLRCPPVAYNLTNRLHTKRHIHLSTGSSVRTVQTGGADVQVFDMMYGSLKPVPPTTNLLRGTPKDSSAKELVSPNYHFFLLLRLIRSLASHGLSRSDRDLS